MHAAARAVPDAPLFDYPGELALVVVLGAVGIAIIGSVFAATLLKVRSRDVLLAGDPLPAAGAAVRRRNEDHRRAGRGHPEPRSGLVLDPVPRNLRCRVPGTVPVDLRVPGDRMKKLAVPVLGVLAAVGFAASIYLVFYDAPLQCGSTRDGQLNGSSLFFNQKIFYFHVAHAFVLFTAVFVAGISSIVFLWTRKPEVGRHRERVGRRRGRVRRGRARHRLDLGEGRVGRVVELGTAPDDVAAPVADRSSATCSSAGSRARAPTASRPAWRSSAWSACRSSTRWSARTRTRRRARTASSRRSAPGMQRRVLAVASATFLMWFIALVDRACPEHARRARSARAARARARSGSAAMKKLILVLVSVRRRSAPRPRMSLARARRRTRRGARAACTQAMNADPEFAKSIIATVDKQIDQQTIEAHHDAYKHIQKNEKHVIYRVRGDVGDRGGCSSLFLWCRQQRADAARSRSCAAISTPPAKEGNVTSSHVIFIPGVLMVGMFLGFIFGARAARNQFDAAQKRAEEREAARAARAARRAAGGGGDGGGEKAAEKTSGKAAE